MKRLIRILISSTLIFCGCSRDEGLKTTIWVYDDQNPGLPAYSEWGYNTFGAYFNRNLFTSTASAYDTLQVSAKIIVLGDTMSFQLSGHKKTAPYEHSTTPIIITFRIPGMALTNYSDLISLDGKVINLRDFKNSVKIDTSGIAYPLTEINGTLTFKRAQNLLVDQQKTEVILSGYFEVKGDVKIKSISISKGRFDVGVGEDNFRIQK
jgi:hypothetical protein